MDYSTILRDNLLSAIEELKKKNNISSTNYYIHVCPDVSEKELSRILSTDLYYREGFINGAYETKSFTVDEFVKAFSPSFGLDYVNACLGISLRQARKNFLVKRACKDEFMSEVRLPLENELDGINWIIPSKKW